MELYNEVRENWERLYWDEGYSKKIARDHANYESAEEDDEDFNPYRFLCLWIIAMLLYCGYSSILWCIDGFGSLVIAGVGVLIIIH